MWTYRWFLAAVLAVAAEGAIRLPLHTGRRDGTSVDEVLTVDLQKLGTIVGDRPDKLWPHTLYSSLEISTNDSSWGDVKTALQNGYDNIYFIAAQVGTPSRNERMIVDTGSSDLWLTSRSYNAEASATSTSLEYPVVTVYYGKGHVSGSEVGDRLCIASLCVDNQSFVVARQDSVGCGSRGIDGLFPLGLPALAVSRGTTLLKNLASNGDFTNFSFALSLRHFDEMESSIVIGELQDVLAEAPSGEGVALPLLRFLQRGQPGPPLYWAVATFVSIGPGQRKHLPAILDSGTSLIAVPPAEFLPLLYTMIPGDVLQDCLFQPGQSLVCPCGIPTQPMHLAFSDPRGKQLNISLTAEDLWSPMPGAFYRRDTHNELLILPACRFGIMAMPRAMPLWLLGEVFLRKVYAVHDVAGLQVILFPQSGVGGHAQSSVGSSGVQLRSRSSPHDGPLDVHVGHQLTALVLLFLTACTLLSAFYRRFHGQVRASEVDGYHNF